ncbi:nuclease-related domain-containing protein [Paraburkholderia sp. A1BS-2L]|uniref:nuclease-related domain-containing protein n=1 Tax=unclassified Paraburkholderia TaxID=2615204 RepID=UPI003B75F22C
MSGLIVLFALGCLGYWHSTRSSNARLGGRRNSGHLAQYEPSAQARRAQQRGEAGEAAVLAELRRVLTWLCGANFHLHDGAVLIHHAPGTAFPTAEIDHLVVTSFGIFVIETKNWSGSITPGAHRDELVRTGADGAREIRRSPLAQNRTKVAFLSDKLPCVWPIDGIGVFASPDCNLHPDLPLPLIHISELGHWMRQRRHEFAISGRKPVNVKTAWQAILLNASISESEIVAHRNRVRDKPKGLADDGGQ